MKENLQLSLLFLTLGLTPFVVRAQDSALSAPGFDPTPLTIPEVKRTTPRPITSMDLLTMRDLRGMQISPDGASVAFAASQAVYETNSYRTGLFVVGTKEGSVPRSLGSAGEPGWDVVGQVQNYTLGWSPDSRFITCLIQDKEHWQVWRWERESGRREQLTHNANVVESYRWSADGKQIIFTVVEPPDAVAAKQLLEDGMIYDGSVRAWGRGTFPRLVLDAKPKKKQTWIYEWANGRERKASAAEVAELETSNKAPGAAPADFVRANKLSPDGTMQAYNVIAGGGQNAGHSIYVNRLGTDKPLRLVGPTFDYIYEVWWSADGAEIYFSQVIDSRGGLFAVPAKGGPVREVTRMGTPTLWSFSFDRAQTTGACISFASTVPNHIEIMDLKTGMARPLVDLNPEFKNITLSPATRLDWTNKYGATASAYLVKPLNYEPGKRYPLIVTTYQSGGFLRGAAGDEYPIQVFAANGFVVLDFTAPQRTPVRDGNFGKAMMTWDSPKESLIEAMKMLDDMGLVDSNHRGLSGLSYGAEVTAYTISHANLFQAASTSQGGGRDPISYYLLETAWQKTLMGWGLGLPDGESAAHWRELSTALNARDVRAALLIQTADSEMMTTLMLYNSLKEFRKPVEMIVYPDEYHVKNQPKHRYSAYQRNLDWFRFWLQEKEDPDPAKAEQYKRWRELRNLQNQSEKSAGSRQ